VLEEPVLLLPVVLEAAVTVIEGDAAATDGATEVVVDEQ